MSEFFLKVINMSISSIWIILAILLLRIILKKSPKWINVLLWGICAIRLLCPFSIESKISLIPSTEVINPDIMLDKAPEINSGIPMVNRVINPIITTAFEPTSATSANTLQLWISTFATIWIVGVILLFTYAVTSYAGLKRKINTAVLLCKNVYQSENVLSPFVFGIIKPKIYLPFNIGEQEAKHVIAHEESHIKCMDHLWKPIGFLTLAVHWFNPLVWLGYILFCNDLELACDERVIGKLNDNQRAYYSQALLSCSINRHKASISPLAFGELSIKKRIRSVLNYKKPSFGIIIVALIVTIALAIFFLTNPSEESISNFGGSDGPQSVHATIDGVAYSYSCITEKDSAYISLVPETKKYFFSFSLFSSYYAMGTYEETDDEIIMKTDDGNYTYTFIKDQDNLIFDASNSSPMPKYAYSSGAKAEICLPDQAVFKMLEVSRLYIDKATFDVDDDGREEECIINYGPTSGLFTFTLTISENGKEEYFNTFNSPYYDLSFVEKNNTLLIQGVNSDYGDTPVLFSISFKDGNAVLTSDNNEALSYWGEQGIESKYN